MPWEDDEEGSSPPPSNYSPADAAVDLRTYQNLKRSISARSLLLILVFAALLALRSPIGGFSLAIGSLCGVLNMWLAMRGNERLVEHRSIGAFVFSSFLRIGVFAIVPVGLALAGPAWTMALYFIGFFTPLLLYMVCVQGAFRRD